MGTSYTRERQPRTAHAILWLPCKVKALAEIVLQANVFHLAPVDDANLGIIQAHNMSLAQYHSTVRTNKFCTPPPKSSASPANPPAVILRTTISLIGGCIASP